MLDANVVLSGLFFEGRERELLKMALRGEMQLVVSEEILLETRAIVERKFSEDAGKRIALEMLALIGRSAVKAGYAPAHLRAAEGLIRDAKDAPILAAALAAKLDFFVTGDRDFMDGRVASKLRVVSPKGFFEAVA